MNDMLSPQVPARKPASLFKVISSSTFKLMSGLGLLGVTIVGVVLFLNKESDLSKVILKNNHSYKTQGSIEGSVTSKDVFVNRDSSLDKGSIVVNEESKIVKEESEIIEEESRANPTDYAEKEATESTAFNVNEAVRSSSKAVSNKEAYSGKRTPEGNAGNNTPDIMHNITENKRNEDAALSLLLPMPLRPNNSEPNLSQKIKAKSKSNVSDLKNAPEETVNNSFHVGLEWSINTPFKRTDFLFNSIDSVKKTATLLIPGIWVTRSFRAA